MRPISAEDLERMRQRQEEAMADECEILAYAAGQSDEFGLPVEAYAASAPSRCGVNPTASREILIGTNVVITDATLRLPIETVLDARDRVRITRRHGEAIEPAPVFAVIGEPLRGPTALLVHLKLVAG